MKDRIEIEGIVEALVTVDKGKVQGKLQIEIGLDALSVENMIILQWTVQQDIQIGSRADSADVQYGQGFSNITNPTKGHRPRQTDYKPSRHPR